MLFLGPGGLGRPTPVAGGHARKELSFQRRCGMAPAWACPLNAQQRGPSTVKSYSPGQEVLCALSGAPGTSWAHPCCRGTQSEGARPMVDQR